MGGGFDDIFGSYCIRASLDQGPNLSFFAYLYLGVIVDRSDRPQFDRSFGACARCGIGATAYIGMCVLDAEPAVSTREKRYLRAALDAAAEFEQASRRSDGTWGYNAHVPPDSDSTSRAAQFLAATGRPPGKETYGALRTFARPDGGFATFSVCQSIDGELPAWTCSHPDVTPVVARALAASSGVSAETLNYILTGRNGEGLWQSYWYRSPLYGTLHNLCALHEAGRTVKPPATAVVAATAAVRDPFELALALEIVTRFDAGRAGGFVRAALATLLALQSPDGWWAAQPMLRVTEKSVSRPWEFRGDAYGPLRCDDYFTFTTATVVRALRRLLREGRTDEEDADG